jgi:hypothetical protein
MKKTSSKNISVVIGIGLCLVLGLVSVGFAQEEGPKVKEEVLESKEIVGELISLSPRNDPQYITVGVDEENTDYMLFIDKDVEVVHKQSLSELVRGDMVRVKYDVVLETKEENLQHKKRIAKVVSFIKRPQEGLSLKGVK